MQKKRKRFSLVSLVFVMLFLVEISALIIIGWTAVGPITGAQIFVFGESIDAAFIPPTPDDDSSTTNTFVEVKVNVTDAADLNEYTFNWDGTNNTYYNGSLELMLNFDNVSALGESDGVVIDLSLYNNTIEVNGTAPTVTSSGMFEGAYEFDKSGCFYTPSYKPEVRTLSFWMNTYSQNGILVPPYDDPINGYIFSQRFDATEQIGEWDMDWFSQPSLRIYAYENNGGSAKGHSLATDTEFSLNTWYHIVVTSNGTHVVYYVDGQLDSTHAHNVVLGGSNNDDDLFIGCGGANDNIFYFNGTLDEVRVWNRTFSLSEVEQMYLSNFRKYESDQWEFYANETELVAGNSYDYYGYAEDDSSNSDETEVRTVNIVAPSVPEFSDYAIALLLLTVVGGFFFMRRNNS